MPDGTHITSLTSPAIPESLGIENALALASVMFNAGHVIDQSDDGVTLEIVVPWSVAERLFGFDADLEDVEEDCEDEGAQCEGEGETCDDCGWQEEGGEASPVAADDPDYDQDCYGNDHYRMDAGRHRDPPLTYIPKVIPEGKTLVIRGPGDNTELVDNEVIEAGRKRRAA